MSIKEFHKSTVEELLAVKDRVRNLINHWGEEGRYKEAVLKSVIKRFLPEQFKIGTGFIVQQTEDRGVHRSSKQIDLIVYNTSYPVLFREGDFVILTPDAVHAIIEVKANLSNQNFKDVLNKANENGKFAFKYKANYPFFNGIFSYDGYENLSTNASSLKTVVSESIEEFETDSNYQKYIVNHIAFNKHLFYKYWENEETKNRIYRIEDLSFAFFISNLIDLVSINSVIDNSKLWFPVDESFNVVSEF